MGDAPRRLKAVQSYQAKKDGELNINVVRIPQENSYLQRIYNYVCYRRRLAGAKTTSVSLKAINKASCTQRNQHTLCCQNGDFFFAVVKFTSRGMSSLSRIWTNKLEKCLMV